MPETVPGFWVPNEKKPGSDLLIQQNRHGRGGKRHIRRYHCSLERRQTSFCECRIVDERRASIKELDLGRATIALRYGLHDLPHAPLYLRVDLVVKGSYCSAKSGQVGSDVYAHATVNRGHAQDCDIAWRNVPSTNCLQFHDSFGRHHDWVDRLLRKGGMRLFAVKGDLKIAVGCCGCARRAMKLADIYSAQRLPSYRRPRQRSRFRLRFETVSRIAKGTDSSVR
jgi:hypothetical protein